MGSAKPSIQRLKTNSVRVFDNGHSYGDVLKSISEDLGNNRIVGCVKTSGHWIVTLKNESDAELIQETGLNIKGDHCNVTGVEKFILTVSLFGVPCYISDEELSAKLEEYGCSIKSKWTRKYYSDYPDVENGIRFVRVQLPNNAKSLPYAITIAGVHLRLKHNSQSKVCNNCLSDTHVMKECPQYVCRECNNQGHTESRCPRVKCFRCQNFGHKSFLCTEQPPEEDNDVEPEKPSDNGEMDTETEPSNVTESANKETVPGGPPAQPTVQPPDTVDQANRNKDQIEETQMRHENDTDAAAPGSITDTKLERNSTKTKSTVILGNAKGKEKSRSQPSSVKPQSQPCTNINNGIETGGLKRAVSSDDDWNIHLSRKNRAVQKKKIATPKLHTARNFSPKAPNSTS